MVQRQDEAGPLSNQFATGCYTHHQKTVICDAEDNSGGLLRVVAFIGGLDINTGRYDTPEFPLFKTLQTLHANDFRNKCFPGLNTLIVLNTAPTNSK